MKSYLPASLSALISFCANFDSKITAAPGTYGLVAGDAVSIHATLGAFATAYTTSTTPATRTSVTVAATNVARNAAVAVVRSYGRIILSNAGVTDENKVALGLIIRDNVNTPVPTPATMPMLTVHGSQPGQLTVSYKDSASGAKVKAKPFGAVACQLFALFGTVAPATPAATPFYGVATRTPFPINTGGGTPGQTAFIYGRWVTQTGKVGPWSPLATAIIA